MNNIENVKRIKYHPYRKNGKMAIEACPEVRDWWDYDKNIGIDISQIAAGSSRVKYHFRCPVCSNPLHRAMTSFLVKENDGTYHVPVCQKCHPSHSSLRVMLSVAVVDIEQYWDYDKNNGKPPSDFSASNQTEKVWTFCPICGESTSRRPRNTWKKDENGVGHVLACKACGKLNKNNSLISFCSEIKDYWIYEKNKLGPECYTFASGKHNYVRCPECGAERYIAMCDAISQDKNGNYYVTSCKKCATKKGHVTRRQKEYNILKNCPDINEFWADTTFRPDELSLFSKEYIHTFCPSCGKDCYRRALNTFKKEGDFYRVISCHDCATTENGFQRGVAKNGPLIDECPEFGEWWNEEKNTIDIRRVSRGSHYEAWVKCPACHHELQRDVHSFVLFHKDGRLLPVTCPECGYSNKGDPEDNLLKLCPEIADWWDYEKNYPFKPEQFSKGASFFAYLNCPECGLALHTGIHSLVHTTETGRLVISHDGRCRKYRAMASENNLVKLYPEVKDWWDYEKNNPKLPEEYTIGSGEQVYFTCPSCNASAFRRISDAFDLNENGVPTLFRCQYCENKRALPGYNSLDVIKPELISEWSPNNEREITECLPTAYFQALWICPTCHGEYPYPIRDREVGDDSCPYCQNKRVLPGFNSLDVIKKDLIPEWSPNNNQSMSEYLPTTWFSALWICPTCHGEYPYPIRDREVGDDSCPYCQNKRVLPGFNSLDVIKKDLIPEWSPNNNQSMSEYLPTTWFSALWICPTCHGEYPYPIRDREVGDDSCPYCQDKRVLPGFNSLQIRHSELMKEWASIENTFLGLNPDRLLDTSSEVAWWICPFHNRKYPMKIRDRVLKEKRKHNPCPLCKGRRWKKIYNV